MVSLTNITVVLCLYYIFAMIIVNLAYSYSQTRSSVPVANELMNSFTEK